MLSAPSSALGGPGQPTRRRIELVADWIELSAYVEDVEIYRHNVRDLLVESYFVVSEDNASEVVDDAWRALRRRARSVGKLYPFVISRESITIKESVDNRYLFLLMLSCPEYFSGFALSRGGGFRNLFEIVAVAAIQTMLPSWKVVWAGATSKAMKSAGGITSFLGSILRTKVINDRHFQSAQDGGVDFIAVHISKDDRTAGPAFWGQCATGMDWDQKLEQPSFNRWKDALRILTEPVRALAVPFVFDEQTWDYASVSTRGWVLDRERLAGAMPDSSDPKLNALIDAWLNKEKKRLPSAA